MRKINGHSNPLTPMVRIWFSIRTVNKLLKLPFQFCNVYVFFMTFWFCQADLHLLQIGMICHIIVLSQGYSIIQTLILFVHDPNTDTNTNLSKWLFHRKRRHVVAGFSSSLQVSYFFIKKTNQKGQRVEPGSGLDTLNPLHHRLNLTEFPGIPSNHTLNWQIIAGTGGWHLIHSKTNSIDKPVCLAHLKSNHWLYCLKALLYSSRRPALLVSVPAVYVKCMVS